MPWTRVAGAGVLATAGALAARYAVQRSLIERSWPTQVAPRLSQIGEVDQVLDPAAGGAAGSRRAGP